MLTTLGLWLGYWLELAPAAWADELVCSSPGYCAAPIRAGEPSPIDGQVLTTSLAVDLGILAEHCDEHVQLAVSATAAVGREALRHQHALDLIQIRTASKAAELWQARAEAPIPFIERPLIVAGITAVVTTAVILVLSKMVSLLRVALAPL